MHLNLSEPLPQNNIYSLYQHAEGWLLRNTTPFQQMMLASRLVIVLLTVALIWVVWSWTLEALGPVEAAVAAACCAFSPSILAFGHLVTTDMGVTLFYLLALFQAWRYVRAPSVFRAFFAGLTLGAALLSKFSALLLLPTLVAILSWQYAKGHYRPKSFVGEGLSFIAGVAVLFPLCYGIKNLAAYPAGLLTLYRNSQVGQRAYLLGHLVKHGRPEFFTVAFLLKNTIGSLALLFAWPFVWRRISSRPFLVVWILFPALLYFGVASFSPMRVGYRYILPVFALSCLGMGAASEALRRTSWGRIFVLAAVLSACLETVIAAPHFIAYFNPLSGGGVHKADLLVDSNLDWGQDLGDLAAYLHREGVHVIYLSYFGSTDPAAYGIRFHDIGSVGYAIWNSEGYAALKEEKRVLLAVSATNRQGVYYHDSGEFSWLRIRQPAAVLGDSIYVYDITGDAEAHRQLGRMYASVMMQDQAAAERQWAELLDRAKG
jgi:hypothetical protein